MRTKDDIIGQYTKDGLDSASDGALSMLTVMNLLEVIIDIRDILKKELKRIDTTETRFIKTP